MQTGRIHSFQSMGAVDGPGLRFVVFMQGCPLRCAYCHNPDTWDFAGGEDYTADQVAAKIRRCLPYLKNGGVTVSGGEPLMQSAFVKELFEKLKAIGVHTALDTSGIGDLSEAEKLLGVTDLVLLDIKFLTNEAYQTHCGADFEKVKAFLNLTHKLGKPIWIRQVIVPGWNDTQNDVLALKDFLKPYDNVEKIELLGFEKLCLEKYKNMHIPFPLIDVPAMDKQKLAQLAHLVQM